MRENSKPVSVEKKDFKCEYCGKTFSDKSTLNCQSTSHAFPWNFFNCVSPKYFLFHNDDSMTTYCFVYLHMAPQIMYTFYEFLQEAAIKCMGSTVTV